ncbi:hypothetical protein [Nonomuraea pusilla]|uniref:Uncharacterized protein n=1 Tax=Nonomuraea pusilla TaxID=46177 RepID=A0A1H8A1G0_9ACTN|nr:hypothetical protein [Nonomuraea pusilla]SEM63629.1 hypothetical protein SAMN05660976_05692 [Nonomuraea pusilla]
MKRLSMSASGIIGTACVLLLAACSHAGASPGAARPSPSAPAGQATGAEVTFMAAYGSYDEQRILDRALQVKIARCMAMNGFTYHLSSAGTSSSEMARKQWGGQFRMDLTNDDVTKSRREGYGFNREPGRQAAPKDPNSFVSSLPPARQQAWNRAMQGGGGRAEANLPGIARVAIPSEGCIGEAYNELYGDLQTYIRVSGVMNGLGIPLKDRWEKDPQVVAAAEPWRRCMNSKGFPFKVWRDAVGAAVKLYEDKNASRQKAHPEEIRIATADAECSVQTGKSRVERARFAHYQQQVPEEWEPQIGQYKQIREAALTRAQVELGSAH